MLKVIHTNGSSPVSLPVDPTAEFQGGMIAQLKVFGNDIVAGVSDGTAPYGIIDDVRTTAFTKPKIDEIVVVNVKATELNSNGEIVNSDDVTGFLEYPNILESSFTCTMTVVLNSVNGAITIPAETPLNYDSDGDGIFDSFRVVVNYIYRVAGRPGDDSTLGSGRVTIHYQRGIYATDQFDTLAVFPVNATLYVGLDGKVTTKQPTETHPGIGFVTGPPSAVNSTLEFMWL
jgi:hypothetical protein